ncbi:hypothetical protein [Sorangium atrum]|uniref:Uncharacterized protein n=1 Tax=Sorangium atrum TaxID=2995308 RepID=A0ABT5C3N8_9BACT|nr:hypothetical protein [Sorangium aterium]MDC0681031.1 hypothetical protein [Sorangium aterium]
MHVSGAPPAPPSPPAPPAPPPVTELLLDDEAPPAPPAPPPVPELLLDDALELLLDDALELLLDDALLDEESRTSTSSPTVRSTLHDSRPHATEADK